MHEAAIAQGIVEQIMIAVRSQPGIRRVREVELRVGALQQVVPEALELAFGACAEGTPASGARLVLSVEPATARCDRCGERFSPDVELRDFSCPRCRRAEVSILTGRDIILMSLECEQEEEPVR